MNLVWLIIISILRVIIVLAILLLSVYFITIVIELFGKLIGSNRLTNFSTKVQDKIISLFKRSQK